jgi:hypothetical protein
MTELAVQLDRGLVHTIAEYVDKGQCILFLGAGVHCRPPQDHPRFTYPDERRPMSGGELSQHLAGLCGFAERFPRDTKYNLQRVARCYEWDRSRGELCRNIKQAIAERKEPSPALLGLATLRFPLIITTNYDHLLEQALERAGKQPFISRYQKNDGKEHAPTPEYPEAVPSPDRPFVCKLHGDIDEAQSIVVTDEDYIHFILRMSDKDPYNPIPQTLRYFFTKWPTLFIGYSLLDYNLRLLFKTLRWQIDDAVFPLTYSVDFRPDPLVVNVLQEQQRYVKFIVQDVWTFVPDLYRLVKGEDMPA